MAAAAPTLRFINEGNLDKRMVEITRSDGSKLAIDIGNTIKFQKADGSVVRGRVYAFSPNGTEFSYSTGPEAVGTLKSGDSALNSVEIVTIVPQGGGARRRKSKTKKTKRSRRYSRRR